MVEFVKKAWRKISVAFVSLLLCGCQNVETYAPVADIATIDPIPKSNVHLVGKDETLYAIAWRYALDFRSLAYYNHLEPPYDVHPGQLIRLEREDRRLANAPIQAQIPKQMQDWVWPAQGKVVRGYSNFNKGVNIAGRSGEPIYAANSGKVVYSGNGLRGYGNLIILKHNDLYLSAYAHNRVILVKEGQNVFKGQQIAEMGNTGTKQTMLHFEIRRAGKPLNPINFYRKKG